jgi:hypothetical protein
MRASARVGTLFWLVLPGVWGCGARSSIDLIDGVDLLANSGASGAGGPGTGGDGGSESEDVTDGARPAEPGEGGLSDDGGCGAPWVVFVTGSGTDGTSTLYAIRADLSDPHPLSLPHANPTFPWISADGSTLVYTTEGGGHLYIHKFATGTDLEIPLPSGVVGGFAALAPDGSALVYSSTAGLELTPVDQSLPSQLLVPNLAGAELGDVPSFPSFTTGGASVVFGTHTAIGEIGVDGSALSMLLSNPGGFLGVDNASFSPDQTSLVAGVACPVGAYGLRVYPVASLPADCAGGTLLAALEAPGPVPFYPTWGPRGLIAYATNQGVMLVNANSPGAPPVNLTIGVGGGATSPAWAPACLDL